MSTANKVTFSRFHDAVNTGDAEVISKTIDEVVFAGGRIAEIWGVVDVLSQMKQLGMIPA